jgi:hypothetical protein
MCSHHGVPQFVAQDAPNRTSDVSHVLLPKVEKVGHNGAHFVSILQLGSKEVLILGGVDYNAPNFFWWWANQYGPFKKKKKKEKEKCEHTTH